MCNVRKPRTSYTLQDDVVLLRETTALGSGVFSGGSAASKLQAWGEIAERVSAQGVDVTSDALRRRVAELVKKFKRQGPEPAEGRMRWGLPWPKSDDEVERDGLIEEYVQRMEEAKQVAAPASRSATKAAPSKKPALVAPPQATVTVPSPVVDFMAMIAPPKKPEQVHASLYVPPKKPAQVHPIPSARRQAIVSVPLTSAATKPTSVKRKQPEPVVIDDDDIDLDEMWSLDPPPSEPSASNERMKLDLKRRRLEMEERAQNRMLDIQAEQITLQREQLRLQAEAMRSMAESTQTIARALQALQKRLP